MIVKLINLQYRTPTTTIFRLEYKSPNVLCFRYEKARGPRKVHQHWKQDRPWLEFLGNDVMRCKWCSAHDELKYTWESGRLETLKYHEASSIHQKALATESVKHAPVGSSPAEVMIQKLNDATVDKLKILFRNAHAISLAGRPFTDFVWMAQLDNIKKLNVGNTYINDKSAREFTSAIAATENEKSCKKWNALGTSPSCPTEAQIQV